MTYTRSLQFLNPKATCALLIAVWAYAFWPTLHSAIKTYVNSGYDYQGLLVLPIMLLLMLRNASQLKRAYAAYNPYGLLVMLASASLWLCAAILDMELLQQVAIICTLITIVLTTCGRKITGILFLPFCCLFLLLPVGQNINMSLQHGFTWLLTQALMLCRQTLYWEAQQIVVNNHIYDLHAYLSSMHYALLYLAFGACFAMLRTKKLLPTITIFSSFLIMPLLILWLALFSYIFLNKLFTNINIISEYTGWFGWTMTMVGLMHAVALGLLIGDRSDVLARRDDIDWRHNAVYKTNIAKPLFLGACILMLVPFISKQVLTSTANTKTMDISMPQQVASWQLATKIKTQQNVAKANFRKDDETVSLAIAATEPHIESNWQQIKETAKKIALAQTKLPVLESVLYNDQNKYQIAWRFTYVNGHITTSPTVAKALTQFYKLSAKGAQIAVIDVSTDIDTEVSVARERLKGFMHDFASNI